MTRRYYITSSLAAIPMVVLIMGFKFGPIGGYCLALVASVGLILSGYWLGMRDRV